MSYQRTGSFRECIIITKICEEYLTMISAFWFFIKNFSNTHVFLKVNRDLSIFLRVLLHLSEVSVDTDLARRKSGDFFSCKGQAKKYGGGGGWAGAERGWVMRFWVLCKGWVMQFSATLRWVGHPILLGTFVRHYLLTRQLTTLVI